MHDDTLYMTEYIYLYYGFWTFVVNDIILCLTDHNY